MRGLLGPAEGRRRRSGGAVETTYERGLWFRTPEAYDAEGNFRASLYLRPLAIWAIEEALRRRAADGRQTRGWWTTAEPDGTAS